MQFWLYNLQLRVYILQFYFISQNCEFKSHNSDFFLPIASLYLTILRKKIAICKLPVARKSQNCGIKIAITVFCFYSVAETFHTEDWSNAAENSSLQSQE